ncbi:MAG: hypothetical protein BGO54_03795 [Sphingobacteriales bacterium 46-32]|nr:MAG: hypothetical protein BGO54_03795 [Sphingobacteriales bacterium 46-32]
MIRSVFFSALFSFILLCSYSFSYGQGSMQTVVLSGLGKKQGTLYIAWYNTEVNFKKQSTPVFTRSLAVDEQEQVSVVFENIPAGRYAIAVLLDQDGNKKMSTNLLGIPREKYGFSNNVYPAFRAANWKEASFELKNTDGEIRIRMK